MSDAGRCKCEVRVSQLQNSTNTKYNTVCSIESTWSREDCGRICMAQCAAQGAECQDWYKVLHVVCWPDEIFHLIFLSEQWHCLNAQTVVGQGLRYSRSHVSVKLAAFGISEAGIRLGRRHAASTRTLHQMWLGFPITVAG